MLDQVTIRVSDRVASRRFYETVLAPLGSGHGLVAGGDSDDTNVEAVNHSR